MLGKFTSLGSSNSNLNNRIFVYEVEGLRQNTEMDANRYPLRSSDRAVFQVPYSRMNAEMRKVTRLGGKIVKICSLSDYDAAMNSTSTDE